MTDEEFAREEAGMFQSALDAQLAQIDAACAESVEDLRLLQAAIEAGDFFDAAAVAEDLAYTTDAVTRRTESLCTVFSQDPRWAHRYAEEALRAAAAAPRGGDGS